VFSVVIVTPWLMVMESSWVDNSPTSGTAKYVGWTAIGSSPRITLSNNIPKTFHFATLETPLDNCIEPAFHVSLINSQASALTYYTKGSKSKQFQSQLHYWVLDCKC